MTYENPYYGKAYYEDLELVPGNRYIFITKQYTKFITSEKQLEGTFIGAEPDWEHASEELPLINPPLRYKFKTEDGNIHIVSSKDITYMVPSPTSELFTPYVPDDYVPVELDQPIADIDAVVYRRLDALARNIEEAIPQVQYRSANYRDFVQTLSINWDRLCEEMIQGKIVL